MNKDQPSTQHNYTEMGFKKAKVPEAAWTLIKSFWDTNKEKMIAENWPVGNTYTNHWESPTYMVSLEDSRLRGYGNQLKKQLWDAIRPALEEWVGRKLTETSLYGIRVYHDKAYLATHVDRLPLVTSAIIQVDQDLNEPWPVEVYSHAGKAYNVTMKPGEMVYYESHTVLHGRPFPMNGSYYANLFIHFVPVDHDEMNDRDFNKNSHPFKETTRDVKVGGHEQSNHDQADLDRHKDAFDTAGDEGEDGYSGETEDSPGQQLRLAAADGDLETVERLVNGDQTLVNARDDNKWQAIHEAVRAGHLHVVKYLADNGADLDGVTMHGGTPLWWARRELQADHSVISYLEEIGAPDFGEDL